MKTSLLLFVLIFALGCAMSSARASTFVGNGGNAADVALQVTLNQIKETLEIVDEENDKESANLCTCRPQFDGHMACETLKKLSPSQGQFCVAFTRKKSKEISDLSQNAKVRFNWTHDSVTVQESGRTRGADAVADSKTFTITINQERYLAMTSYERIFLLTHELAHLTRWENRDINDEQKIGPFNNEDGGRNLLNAMAAATVMRSYDYGTLRKYQSTLKRSHNSQRHWVDVDFISSSASEDKNSTFFVNKHSGASLTYRYQFSDFGVWAQLKNMSGTVDVLTTIEGKEAVSAASVGMNYRLRPFEDPMSFLGQSHFIFAVGVEAIQTKYHLTDTSIDETDTASAQSLVAHSTYYMPLQSGFWLSLGLGYAPHSYTYETLGIEANKSQISYRLGVSYGF